MSTKPQIPGQSPTSTAPAKQARSRKAAQPNTTTAGRAGSAGGVVLEKEAAKKGSIAPSTTTITTTAAAAAPSKPSPPSTKDAPPKRKPRKLNKEPTSTLVVTPSTDAAELEALKSRVRGLEAKVEQLYKSAPTGTVPGAPPRSPRRRGKGRKTSSATTTATLGSLAQKDGDAVVSAIDDDEEADEDAELTRLESELALARHDLALYTPNPPTRPRASRSPTDDTVEDIPRTTRPSVAATHPDRQVTLSGSYRIPLPASLDPEDVRTIQSGVVAAQNVARSFMEQRRAARGAAEQGGGSGSGSGSANANASSKTGGGAKGKARKQASNSGTEVEAGAVAVVEADQGRQSWGEWIGGYSMAISRAVKSIEHEAAMEAQRGVQAAKPAQARRKRPAARTGLSEEQVEGLMS